MVAMSHREPERVQSASRAFQLLGLLIQRAPASLRVTDAASALAVNSTTVHRLLSTLVSEGFATRLANRTYTVGPLSLRMASHWLEPMQEEALPYLERIATRAGETVHLLKLLGRDVVSIARISSKNRPVFGIERDITYPLWATAGGKAILSQLPRVEQVRLLPPEPYPRFTPRTLTHWHELSASLESGVFVERGEFSPKLACVALPFVLPQRSDALSIAVSVPITRSDADLAALLRALRDANSA
jgi:DNA-binding IclR family transcriptional regulator